MTGVTKRLATLEDAGRNLLDAVTDYLVPPPQGDNTQVQMNLMARCREMRTAIAGDAPHTGPTREQLQADLTACRARVKRLRSQLQTAQNRLKAQQEN